MTAPHHEERTILAGAIQRALESRPEIAAAWLFGSHARGRSRPDSDIDVAVLFGDRERGGKRERSWSDEIRALIGALSTELAADRLDVVILDQAPPAVAFQVLAHGRLAFVRDADVVHRFKVRVFREHADFEPTERLFREALIRRVRTEMKNG